MITKKDIEKIKEEIIRFAKEKNIGKDFSIFYNGEMFTYALNKDYRYYPKIKKNVNPLDYCEYFPEKNIISLAYDGKFYEMMDGELGWGLYEEFCSLFEKYGLYIEHSDSCHAAAYPSGDNDYNNYEYTEYKKEKIVNIYQKNEAPDDVFQSIMDLWYQLSRSKGDVGSCVIGAYMEMDYKDNKYRVSPQSPYQGSISWEYSVDLIKKAFEFIGAENVYFNYGRMD